MADKANGRLNGRQGLRAKRADRRQINNSAGDVGILSLVIALLALVNPTMRAVTEVMYQSERPWIVDHSKFARAFGAHPTPHAQAITQTIAWFRAHKS